MHIIIVLWPSLDLEFQIVNKPKIKELIIIFLNVTPFSPIAVFRQFGRMYWLHLQDRIVNDTGNQYEADEIEMFFETSHMKLNIKQEILRKTNRSLSFRMTRTA